MIEKIIRQTKSKRLILEEIEHEDFSKVWIVTVFFNNSKIMKRNLYTTKRSANRAFTLLLKKLFNEEE